MMKKWTGKTGAVYCFGECDLTEAQVRASLGEPHFVETDPKRTHSGIEMGWIFETENGNALAFSFHQIIGRLFIATNGDQSDVKDEIKRNFEISYSSSHGLLWN